MSSYSHALFNQLPLQCLPMKLQQNHIERTIWNRKPRPFILFWWYFVNNVFPGNDLKANKSSSWQTLRQFSLMWVNLSIRTKRRIKLSCYAQLCWIWIGRVVLRRIVSYCGFCVAFNGVVLGLFWCGMFCRALVEFGCAWLWCVVFWWVVVDYGVLCGGALRGLVFSLVIFCCVVLRSVLCWAMLYVSFKSVKLWCVVLYCIVAWRCAFQDCFITRPLTSPDNKTMMDLLRKINSCHVESRFFSLIFFYLWGCESCSVLLQCRIHGFVSGNESSYLVLSDLAVTFIWMMLGDIFLHLKTH